MLGPRQVLARFAIAAGGLTALGAVAFLTYSEMRRSERDRHAIRNQVRELERMIRNPDAKLFLEVESEHAGKRPEHDPAHDAMLRDFEVLSHLEGVRIKDVVVVVDADAATASYRLEGRARGADIPGLATPAVVVPKGGEIRFFRSSRGWKMARHRFVP